MEKVERELNRDTIHYCSFFKETVTLGVYYYLLFFLGFLSPNCTPYDLLCTVRISNLGYRCPATAGGPLSFDANNNYRHSLYDITMTS